jgi:diaminopimelate decarboxylase
MKPTLTDENIETAFRTALQQGMIRGEDTTVVFHDLTYLGQRIHHLQSLFPKASNHAVAIKANPLVKVLEYMKPFETGIEAATVGEVYLALRSGYDPKRIVYDSPTKTIEELRFAMETGIHINIDNFGELERVANLRREIPTASTFGIRINPQVGTGGIAQSSVAGEYSKFGIPIKTSRIQLVNAFRRYDWLTGLHLHVGSQGCGLDLLVRGVGVLYDFMQELHQELGEHRITHFDIGGGVPVIYNRSSPPFTMEEYATSLRNNFPELFHDAQNRRGALTLITEFGRWIHVNAGWVACRVEYVKHDPPVNTAMIHAGADLFLRECLLPQHWNHEYLVLDKEGKLLGTGHRAQGSIQDYPVSATNPEPFTLNPEPCTLTPEPCTLNPEPCTLTPEPCTLNLEPCTLNPEPYNLAGPLCFSGDMLATGVKLPEIKEGDYIIVRDTGGYTFSMWSRYNSRQTPRILGYHEDGRRFEILKERETLNDIYNFWR